MKIIERILWMSIIILGGVAVQILFLVQRVAGIIEWEWYHTFSPSIIIVGSPIAIAIVINIIYWLWKLVLTIKDRLWS